MPRLPAEWEPQSAVMLTWPHDGTDWAHRLDEVDALYAALAALITSAEPVLVVCRDADHRRHVAGLLAAAQVDEARVCLGEAPSNDTWARDHGPITLLDDGAPVLADFVFNGWGGKFRADLDDRITATLHEAGVFGPVPRHPSPLVLEGGAIETDGAGTLLAVTRTLVDPLRNPGWSREAIEDTLRHTLGVHRFLWLDEGALTGDDTDGHIDTLARFCDPQTLCYLRCDDPADPDYPALSAMEAQLHTFARPDGQPYRLVPLPLPSPIHDAADGRRLPATYANFLIVNGAVLVPVYDDPADAIALTRLAACFPGRRVLPLPSRTLIHQGGSLHCITMQLPAALAFSHRSPASG